SPTGILATDRNGKRFLLEPRPARVVIALDEPHDIRPVAWPLTTHHKPDRFPGCDTEPITVTDDFHGPGPPVRHTAVPLFSALSFRVAQASSLCGRASAYDNEQPSKSTGPCIIGDSPAPRC